MMSDIYDVISMMMSAYAWCQH